MWETGWGRTKLMEKSASNSAKPRILFVLHLPPPVHGAAMMGQAIRESEMVADAFDARFVNLSASASLSEVGRVSMKKLAFLSRLLRQVRKEVRDFRPDLVYLTPTSSGPGLIKDCLTVRSIRKRGSKVVLHFHNKGVSARQDRFPYSFLYRSLFKDAKVILLSERLYPDVERFVVRENAFFCPNGIDGVDVRRREKQSVPEILFLSNLLPDKGVVDLLDACKILVERGLRFSCRFVGAPSADLTGERFARLVEERNLQSVIRFDGPLYGSAKLDALADADMLVHPTRDDAFPLVILEAMAAGLAVVSTREGGIPDEVEDGITGILCDKENPSALADAIGKLLEQPDLCREMGNAGRTRYEKLFTKAAFEQRFVEILKQIV
jgi:glycosyltransferase involved in cell wall biosynthesis